MVLPIDTDERQIRRHAFPGLTERTGNRTGTRAVK
jgi:hypothetical protein